jgi:hypothetical protein
VRQFCSGILLDSGEANQQDAKAKLVQAFQANKLPSLLSMRASLRISLLCPYPELCALGDSLGSEQSERLKLRKELLSVSLKEVACLGECVEQCLDLLKDITILSFVFKNLVRAATPTQQAHR